MPDDPQDHPTPATESGARTHDPTQGGVSVSAAEGGQVRAGGDIVGRDKITNYLQLDVEKLVGVLREALPDDPAPEHLREALRDFRHFHARLFEWKELHNYINDIVYVVDQFSREVERMDASGQPGDLRALRRLWRPVAQKVTLLLDWAATIQHIDSPYMQLENGSMQGPSWAVELQAARARLDELLRTESFDPLVLYDATYDFSDTAGRHMYLADKQLRNTAGELYNLSRVVLGSVTRD